MPVKVWGAGSNQGADNDWNNPLNWDGDSLPVDGDAVIFDSTTSNSLFIGPSTNVTLVNFIINNDYLGGVNFLNPMGSSTGVIINGGLLNYSNLATGNFALENCTSLTGLWDINFISRTGDLYSIEPQYFSISNLIFDLTTIITPTCNFTNGLEYRNYNDPSGTFSNFTIDTVAVNYISLGSDFYIKTTNTNIINGGSLSLIKNKAIFIQTENLNINNSVFEIFPADMSSFGGWYEGDRITFSSTSILNIQINGSGRFFSNMRYSQPGGTINLDLNNLTLTFSAPTINYNQTGNFHLCISEGYLDDFNPYTPGLNRQSRIIFNGTSNIAIRGNSMVSGDASLSASPITCSLYDNAIVDGHKAITAYMYDNSRVECLKSYYYQTLFNGSVDRYIIFDDYFYGSGFYQNRKSNKSSF